MNLTYQSKWKFILSSILATWNHTMNQYPISYPESLFFTSSRIWRNGKLKLSMRNNEENTSSNGRATQKRSEKPKPISRMYQKLSRNGRRVTAIRIINSTIRELIDWLEEFINEIDKYRITKNLGRISETLINAWTTMKNLTKRERKDSIALTSQNNLQTTQEDLSSDWKLRQARKWKKENQPGYNTEKILRTGPSTEKVLEQEGKRIRQAMEDDLAQLMNPGNVLMTRKECAALQEAWKAWPENEEKDR